MFPKLANACKASGGYWPWKSMRVALESSAVPDTDALPAPIIPQMGLGPSKLFFAKATGCWMETVRRQGSDVNTSCVASGHVLKPRPADPEFQG